MRSIFVHLSSLIGLLIFIILMIINFIVITNGAGRVSEVAARFTLDAMPGKQLAIDADFLNRQVLIPDRVVIRREGMPAGKRNETSWQIKNRSVRINAIPP